MLMTDWETFEVCNLFNVKEGKVLEVCNSTWCPGRLAAVPVVILVGSMRHSKVTGVKAAIWDDVQDGFSETLSIKEEIN